MLLWQHKSILRRNLPDALKLTIARNVENHLFSQASHHSSCSCPADLIEIWQVMKNGHPSQSSNAAPHSAQLIYTITVQITNPTNMLTTAARTFIADSLPSWLGQDWRYTGTFLCWGELLLATNNTTSQLLHRIRTKLLRRILNHRVQPTATAKDLYCCCYMAFQVGVSDCTGTCPEDVRLHCVRSQLSLKSLDVLARSLAAFPLSFMIEMG